MSARLDREFVIARGVRGGGLGALLDHLRNRKLDYDEARRVVGAGLRTGAIKSPSPEQKENKFGK